MMTTPIPTDEEFDSLPPAVRRKFFSNLERLRLERMRLEHSDPSFGQDHSSGVSAAHHFQLRKSRTTSRVNTSPKKRGSQRGRRLRKAESAQAAYLATRSDSLWFHSLPPKIQQKQFSKEERIFLRQGYRNTVILDAADEALCRLEQRRQTKRSLKPSQSEPSSTRNSIVSQASQSPVDSAIDMDSAFIDSSRWLEGDGDLDLSLYDYHTHVVDTVPTSEKPPRRRPTFRRTLSITPMHLNRASISNIHTKVPGSSRSTTTSPQFAKRMHRASTSRPASSHPTTSRHVSRGSVSSIEPGAQYYQDPDARLKLRVYLASPQKFDEAVEFGFPSLENQEGARTTKLPADRSQEPDESSRIATETDSTFGDEDTLRSRRNSIASPLNLQRLSRRIQPVPVSGSKTHGHNREMTLKMTLTRPDLRTDSPVSPSMSEDSDDPLKLADLPPADQSSVTWNSQSDERGVIKKVWQRLRGKN
ncbi:hypothetical protein PVAR5_8302 [Paecilomyces variotii No. 5]|uniref:Mucin n=1 Tax=Byssochlamys spectabilis (strain No. 5 / NBRC 109023) TaxID=1356009 RepID=V5I5T2_BYSSN|nr:hypothetical protein PVAR5_8302 [Paecilomyces variotii No. 5]